MLRKVAKEAMTQSSFWRVRVNNEAKIVNNRRNNLEVSALRKSLRSGKEGKIKTEKLNTSGNSL